MNKSVVAVRHVPFEDLGCFERVFGDAGYDVRYHDVGLSSASLADLHPEILVVLGGPISAYEEDKYPFLADEIALIEARLSEDRPVLGICLGAQLMARALGVRVYPGPAKEIGLMPIHLTPDGRASCLSHFATQPVLHWHGDTFDLPSGAVRLASTELCPNQAFARGRNAIAIQFHPEAGGAGFERWLIGHTVELAQAGVNVPALRHTYDLHKDALRRSAEACLRSWLSQLEL